MRLAICASCAILVSLIYLAACTVSKPVDDASHLSGETGTQASSIVTLLPITPTPLPSETPAPFPTAATTPYPTSTPTWSSSLLEVLPTPLAYDGTPIPDSMAVISPENASQVVEIARLGKGSIEQVFYTPDDTLLIVGTSRAVYVFDARTLTEIRHLETNATERIVLAPNGVVLAIGLQDGGLWLYEITTGEVIRHWRGHSNGIVALSFSSDSQMLASGAYDDTARLWRVDDGALLYTLDCHTSCLGELERLALSADGQTLITVTYEEYDSYGHVYLWSLLDGRLIQEIEEARSLTFSQNKQVMAAIIMGGDIRVWRMNNGQEIYTLSREVQTSFEDPDAASLAFSPDARFLAVGRSFEVQPETEVWRLSDGALLHVFQVPDTTGHSESLSPVIKIISDLSFSPDGKILIFSLSPASPDLWFWNIEDGSLQRTVTEIGPYPFIVSPDGMTLAVWGWDGIEQRSLESGHTIRSIDGFQAPFTRFPNGQMVVNGELWTGADDLPPYPEGRFYASCGFSSDGQTRIVIVDEKVMVQSLDNGAIMQSVALADPEYLTGYITCSPDQKYVVARDENMSLQVWNFITGEHLCNKCITGAVSGEWVNVQHIAFSPDGQILATALGERTIRLWRLSDFSLLSVLEPKDIPWVMVFSPDIRVLATNTGEVWDVENQDLLYSLEINVSIGYLDFSPDGQVLVSSDSTGEIQLWDAHDGRLLNTLGRHPPNGSSVIVGFSLDGHFLASTSNDGVIRL